ncbi:DNA photolyase, FAD-binding/Cryptochrome [Xylaria bambusicola]|uniref:DNA photolyase, FAD-binding/Cryptochrome n=1 Tax=Xylaria bambusicola TaxID=326684 RepID=UPI002007BB91|nr:DNA photolyase, FAD-binding/Cryptochrome [Xylaria bambusicola]KAI0505131.1 DNA photolyase, FAD-binding/Cryptochrome [Xylaria bambusicola]
MGEGKKHERSASSDLLKHPSTKRAKEVDSTDNPYKKLKERIEAHSSLSNIKPRTVLHWFRSKDLRAEDNRALHAASQQARESGSTLITCFLYSPKDLQWHGTSPARSDFMFESLRLVQEQLDGLNIPLIILAAEERGQKGEKIMEFIAKYDVSHVYANYEYEVDEIRRDLDLLDRIEADGNVHFDLHHDQTVVEPGTLLTGSGGPHKVFTPYHKAWLSTVSEDPSLIDTVGLPSANDKAARQKLQELFRSQKTFPRLPKDKLFPSDEDRDRIRGLWPAGHEAAMKRLRKFLNEKVDSYAKHRSIPAEDNASRMSAYFAAGVVSVREVLSTSRKERNSGSADFSSSGNEEGLAAWVRELVFREFYRHMMVVTPHNSMNLPQNLKFNFVEWEEDDDGWRKWCEGTTGVPFVDAGMRQLIAEAYMHNRLRMNVASYLRTNLLLDYRRGERWFAENLVDWDLCNNTQGWEPSYTVFNPISQAEKCDPHGDYIRKYVPELRDVKGKAIFDPFHRLDKDAFEKLGYPKPHVDWKQSKERALQRYKRDMADADP